VSQAGTRTRAVNKALSKVEDLELPSSSADILGISIGSALDDQDLETEESNLEENPEQQ
jgi:hypothetical protein